MTYVLSLYGAVTLIPCSSSRLVSAALVNAMFSD